LPSILFSACLVGPLGAASTGNGSGHGELRNRAGSHQFHTRLEASIPADGDILITPLPTARFEFSGPVEPSLTRLLLRFPSGDSSFLGTIAVPDSAHVIRAEFPDLDPGSYSIAWNTVSVDGHAADGVIAFGVAASTESRTPAAETVVDTTAAAEADVGAGRGAAAPTEPEVAGPPLRRTLFRGLGLACLLAPRVSCGSPVAAGWCASPQFLERHPLPPCSPRFSSVLITWTGWETCDRPG